MPAFYRRDKAGIAFAGRSRSRFVAIRSCCITLLSWLMGKTRSMFQRDSDGNGSALPPGHPQPYGRAGGYVGWERIAVLSMVPTMANSAVVHTGAEWGNLADMRTRSRGIESTDTAEALDHRSSASDPTVAPANSMRDEDTPAAAVTPTRSSNSTAAKVTDTGDSSAMTGHSSSADSAIEEPVYRGSDTDPRGSTSFSDYEQDAAAARRNDLGITDETQTR